MAIKDNEYYKSWIKSAWPYVTGAVLLSLFQIVTLAVTGNPWGVSGVLANWGAWLWEAVGGNVDKWYYFSSEGAQRTLEGGFFRHGGSIRNLGIIFGALLAVLLSLFQIVTLAVTGNPWGVSGVLANWGAWLWEAVGGSVDKWYYFSSEGAQRTLEGGFFRHGGSIRNLGIIFGALLAVLLASGFKIKKLKSVKQLIAAILGGLLMGYGARIGFGCNIGAFYSGIASFSLSGWVFGLALFLGAIVGSKLLVKYFM